jgi:ornithine cyclodeaminase/alanine dehydrogenase-like protein (mu-crystallin family)
MYISDNEIRGLLSYDALIPAIRQALIDYSQGLVDQPPRSILRANSAPEAASDPANGWFAVMPVVYGNVMGVKTVTFFAGNAKLGLHTHMAVIELLSRRTGEPLAIMDGRLITEMRTAAVSAVALDALAGPEVKSLGILGAGVQARSHLEALRRVRPSLTDVRIWSRTPARAEKLAAKSGVPSDRSSSLGWKSGARATRIEEAAAADVVLTATASPTPVLEGGWLAPHALVLAVGAVGAHLRELDDEAARSCFVVAESRQGVERESGDILLSGAKVRAEIGEVLAGLADVASNPAHPVPRGTGRILFKSVGMAIEDLVAARLVWQSRAGAKP